MDRSFIELLKRISTIPSPTFREKEKGELIASLLARAVGNTYRGTHGHRLR